MTVQKPYDMFYAPIPFKSFFEQHLGRDVTHNIEEIVNWHAEHIYVNLQDKKDITSNIVEEYIDRLCVYGDDCHVKASYIRELYLIDPFMTFDVKYADIIYCICTMPDKPIECRLVLNTTFHLATINAKIIMTHAFHAHEYINTHLVIVMCNDINFHTLPQLDPNRFVVVNHIHGRRFERIDNNPLWQGKSANQIIYGYPGQRLE